MGKTNAAIRETASKANVKHWQIADVLGIREETLSRKLRHQLDAEEEQKIIVAIKQIAEAENNKGA